MQDIIPVSGDLAKRLEEHARIARGALSPNTEKAVRSDTAIFAAWASEHAASSLPASPDVVAAFIDYMAGRRATATVRRYVASIAHMHRAAGLESPTRSEMVRLALKRVGRMNGKRQRQATGLNRPWVDRIIEACGERAIDLRDRALVAVAYDTLCRRSELVALDIEDLRFTDDGTGTALVQRSKSDQEGEGSVRFIAHDTRQHVEGWLSTAGVTEGALFRSVTKGGQIGPRLSSDSVSRILKRRALVAGIDPATVEGISGHSARVGAAQDMVAEGLGIAETMQAGGWKSPAMVGRYTENQQARRGAMSKLAAKQGRL